MKWLPIFTLVSSVFLAVRTYYGDHDLQELRLLAAMGWAANAIGAVARLALEGTGDHDAV